MKLVKIVTERLELVPVTSESCSFELHAPDRLATLLHCSVNSWPPEQVTPETVQEFISMLSDPDALRLFSFYWIKLPDSEDEQRVLIGSGGFLFDGIDTFELGYSVLPLYQGRGYATEASLALVKWARGEESIHHIIAHTCLDLKPSIRVLQKCGFVYDGPGEEETIRFRYPGKEGVSG